MLGQLDSHLGNDKTEPRSHWFITDSFQIDERFLKLPVEIKT